MNAPGAREHSKNAEMMPPAAREYRKNVEMMPSGEREYRKYAEMMPPSDLPRTLVAETCLQGSISCFWRAAPKRRFPIKILLKLSIFGLSASRDRFEASPS